MILTPLGLELTNPEGEPINSQLVALIATDEINQISKDAINTNYDGPVPSDNDEGFNRIFDFNPAMAYTVFEAVNLLTGTYIFHILTLFGVPHYLTTGLIIIYTYFLIRTIAGMLRGF